MNASIDQASVLSPVEIWMNAWRKIKIDERCTTQEAMGRAQDRFPTLYKQFLEHCPRRRR